MLCGVCAGLGRHYNSDPVSWRVFFLLSATFGGLGLLAYLIFWIIIPSGDEEKDKIVSNKVSNKKKLFRSSHNKILAGVCGGISEYFQIDSRWVRVGFIIFSSSLLVVYFLIWLIVPIDKKKI